MKYFTENVSSKVKKTSFLSLASVTARHFLHPTLVPKTQEP